MPGNAPENSWRAVKRKTVGQPKISRAKLEFKTLTLVMSGDETGVLFGVSVATFFLHHLDFMWIRPPDTLSAPLPTDI